MRIDAPIITGSFSLNGDTFNDLGAYTTTGSNTFIGDQSIVGAVSASALTGSISYTNLTGVPTLVSGSDQVVSILSSLNSYTQSNDTTNTTQNSRLTSLEEKTGSLASTGSNTFYGTQTISGTVYIANDLIVQGSSSLQNITASAVSIGTNKVILNTDNPAVRYAGISVIDSGSTGLTGSILWDSTNNNWLYQNPSGSSYVSAKFISGPTSQTLGSEPGLVTNFIQKAVGDDHISSSAIFDDGTTIGLKSNTEISGSLKVTGSLSIQSGSLSVYNSQSIFFNDSTDNNWKIYRFLTASFTKSLATGSTLNINAHYGIGEGFAIGGNSGISYYEIQGSTTSPIHFFRGNVGIGTSASYPLTIYASSTQTSIGLLSGYSNTSARNWGIASNALTYGDFNLIQSNAQGGEPFSAGTSRLYISGSGNIGIGNTAPQAVLHLGASLNTLPSATSIAVAGDTSIRFTGGSDGNSNYGSYIAGTQYSGVRALSLGSRQGAGDVLAMTIIQGKVGIGTTDPSEKLQVSGSITATGTITAGSTLQNTYHYFYSFVGSGTQRIATIGSNAATNGGYIKFINDSSAGGVRGVRLGVHGNGTTPDAGTDVLTILDSGATSVLYGLTVNSGNIVINSDGNYTGYSAIGFSGGVTNGGAKIFGKNNGLDALYVCGPTSYGVTMRVNGTSESAKFYSSGNVALGMQSKGLVVGADSDSPAATLDVRGNIYQTGNSISTGGVNSIYIAGSIAGNASASWTINCSSQSSLRITAVMNHYGYISSYGCQRMSLVANGPVFTEINVTDTSTGNGGSWSFAAIDSTRISITKNAGSYGGGGLYFIEVVGNNPWY